MSTNQPLFHKAYGEGLSRLPVAIVRLHEVTGEHCYEGRASVKRGGSLLARMICTLVGFPPAGEDMALHLTLWREGSGERWQRRFGETRLTSILEPGHSPGMIKETLWPAATQSFMDADETGVTQRLCGFSFAGVPLPAFLWPRLSVRESASGSRYQFSMALWLPWGDLLIHYEGWLETEPAPTTQAARTHDQS